MFCMALVFRPTMPKILLQGVGNEKGNSPGPSKTSKSIQLESFGKYMMAFE